MLDFQNLFRFTAALAIVLLLIAAVAWVIRRFAAGGSAYGRPRRLALVETLALDGKSRLAIIRRDDVEHLVLLGPSGGALVEAGFKGPPPAPAAGPLPAASTLPTP